MAAERQVAGGGSGGRGAPGGNASGGGSASGPEESKENKENEKPKPGALGDSLGLEILQIVKESQQQHGLRHGDFQRYRGYCSRRLRRLRKTLNFKMGNRHKFTGKKVTEELLSDNRYLLLILMDAERAWSYAMQLKQEANTEPRKRFHLLSRLRKAVKHAEELERLCESNRVDAKTKLEAQAYTAYLTGMLRFERQEWKAAMEAFNKCKTIYEKLASAFTEEQAILYNQRVEEISPNIRYCAYNIGDQSAISELMQMRLRSGGTEGLIAEKLEMFFLKLPGFLYYPADIGNLVSFSSAFSEPSLDIWQLPLHVLLESVLQDLEHYLTGMGNKGVTLEENYEYTLVYKLLNEQLICKLTFCWFLNFYFISLKNLAELPQLPGLEEDKSFLKEIGIKTLVYKAYRCFFIAQSYVLVKKWSEALVLYERVLKYANEVQIQAGTYENSLKELPDVQELITQVNAEKYSLQAAAILDADDSHETESPSQVKDGKPLSERFETFCLDPSLVSKQARLVHFPPDFQPIPCKPLFFDLALNHVTLPPLEDKVEQKSKSGLTGYIKGIFGFRS
uniref:Signal recognition particle subunit SRP68 n=1 Tax=Anolis carolinensis TaxID=28377 RepID=A0A803TFP7_ANOCA